MGVTPRASAVVGVETGIIAWPTCTIDEPPGASTRNAWSAVWPSSSVLTVQVPA